MRLSTSLLQSKKSIGRFLIVSYLIVFISLVFGLLAGYVAAYNALRLQEINSQQQTLMRVRGTADAFLGKVLDQMSVYAMSTATKDYAAYNENATIKRARAMAAAMQNIDVANSLLQRGTKLCAYFFNSKVLLTVDSVVTQGGLANYLTKTLDLSEDEFNKIIGLSNIKYRSVTAIDKYTEDCRVVLMQSIIGNRHHSIEGVVFTLIPYSSIANAMRIDVVPDGAELLLSDGQLALNGVKISTKDSIYSQLDSEYLPYYYQYTVPNHILLSHLSGSAFILQGILAASLLFGIAVTGWSMRSRLKLLRHLMRVFIPEQDVARRITIGQIAKRLQQITQESLSVSRSQEDQSFLKALDTGNELDVSVAIQPGKEGIDLLLLFDPTLDDGSDALLYTDPEARAQVITRAYGLAGGFASINNGRIVCDDSILIILIPANIEETAMRHASRELITTLQKEVSSRYFGCYIRVGGVKELPTCFSHAMDTLLHYSFWNLDAQGPIVGVSSLSFEAAELRDGKSRWLSNRAYRCISIGAYAEAYDLLIREMNERFQPVVFAAANNVPLLHGMSAMIVNTLCYRAPLTDRECIQALKPDERLLKCTTLASFRCEFDNIFDVLIQREKSKASHAPKWFEQMQAFLKENYRNPNLSIGMVTEELGISPSYASEEYRKFTGVGIPDTIHMLRITEAKMLFARGNSVKTAAEHLGYVDSRSLIRAFKKYEGMTPGKYIDEIVKEKKGADTK